MEKQKLPGVNTALILGICSIVTFCCCFGLPGIILGLIGLNKAKKAKSTYDENPELYIHSGNIEAGRITSIIGLVFGIIYIIYFIYLVTTGDFSSQWAENEELINDIFGN